MKVGGRGSGRVSVAGLIAMRPASRTWPCHRILRHSGCKGERRSLSERDYIGLIDGVHRPVGAPIVLVWDRLNTHVSHAIRHMIDEREWLTVFLLPAYAPELNPVEYLWAHVKRSLANLAGDALDRLKRLRYRSSVLGGFLPASGLPFELAVLCRLLSSFRGVNRTSSARP